MVPGLEFSFRSELPECSPPLSVTLFLKPCHSFLGPKNNVLGRCLSDSSVVGTRYSTVWEGSSRASMPAFLQLGWAPGAFRSGRPQMPPCISSPGFGGGYFTRLYHVIPSPMGLFFSCQTLGSCPKLHSDPGSLYYRR